MADGVRFSVHQLLPSGVAPADCGRCGLQDMDLREALRLAEDMRQTAAQIEACVRPLVEAFGLDNKAYEVLACLADAGGAMLLKELARQVRLDRARQTRFLDGMEADGWLWRERQPQDRRTVTIRLTPRGEQLAREMARQLQRVPLQRHRLPLPSALACLMGQCRGGGAGPAARPISCHP